MKEAFGGIFNIMFMVIFLVIVIGVLGLVFSYTKAFKMKNAIISTIENYEGSGCYPETKAGASSDTACRREIKRLAQDLKYNPVSLSCSGGCQVYGPTVDDANKRLCPAMDTYCYNVTIKTKSDGSRYATFRVVTQVDMNFPIIEKIMGFSFFQVVGDTKEIKLKG